MATYSFQDVTCSFQHPSVGAASTTGAGIGSINISMATTKTEHNVAADGTVMSSKIAGSNGTISVQLQQTSDLNRWLLKWYNYVESADSSEWTAMNITIKSKNLEDYTVCTGVSPEKLPDKPYQAQGQMITWQLMATNIAQN
ncbi:phage protein [Clostridium sp.]|uniref:phage protein n=1 Tax=Clostridium sp. TaxID=1506 RepID=UPI002629BDF7|nr:phage protein [Clostridium sp.]